MALRTLAAKASVRSWPSNCWTKSNESKNPRCSRMRPPVIEDACGAGHVDAAQRSCQALHFAGDAIMTDTEAFCAALGKANGAPGQTKDERRV